MEDNTLQKRCEVNKLIIDRSIFYEIGKPQILQLFDGISRIISKKDPWRSDKDDGVDGLRTISKLDYGIDTISTNPNDNIFSFEDPRIFYVNIKTFLTLLRYENDEYFNYDLREPRRKIIHPDKLLKHANKVVTNTDDWSNIPYYPTTKEKREQTAEYLLKSGKQVPISLLEQIKKDKDELIRQDVFNNISTNNSVVDYGIGNDNISSIPINNHQYSQQIINRNRYSQGNQGNERNQNNAFAPPMPRPPPLYSPEYANYIGSRPRAMASARIRLGGVF